MPRTERLRRVLTLCCHFATNLAYYDAGRRGRSLRLKGSFWRTTNDNFYDLCVLEWCKLFADSKDPHNWRNVVSDPPAFERELQGRLVMPGPTLERYVGSMKRYRDKFVAHLDSDRIMAMPNLNIARGSTWVYYEHVVKKEAKPLTARSFPESLRTLHQDRYYECLDILERCGFVPGR